MIPHLYLYADDWRAMDVNDGFAGSWVVEVAPRALLGDCIVGSAGLFEYHCTWRPTRHYAALRGKTRQVD